MTEPRTDSAGRVWIGDTRAYTLYCGNFDCSTRLNYELHVVAEPDLPDGEIWYCPTCRDKKP